jgi:hypothetical protein
MLAVRRKYDMIPESSLRDYCFLLLEIAGKLPWPTYIGFIDFGVLRFADRSECGDFNALTQERETMQREDVQLPSMLASTDSQSISF